MRKPALLLVQAIILAFMVGYTPSEPENAQEPARPGSDTDAHGCTKSAGYSWCERTNQCERPWELAEQKGFENTPEAFQAYCQNPSQ